MRETRTPARQAFLALTSILAAVALAGAATSAPGRPAASERKAVPGSILVGFEPGVSPAGQGDAVADAGARRTKSFSRIRGALVSVEPRRTAQAIRALERDPRVAYAEPNFVVRAEDHGGFPRRPGRSRRAVRTSSPRSSTRVST
jgi:hypothetical protein